MSARHAEVTFHAKQHMTHPEVGGGRRCPEGALQWQHSHCHHLTARGRLGWGVQLRVGGHGKAATPGTPLPPKRVDPWGTQPI